RSPGASRGNPGSCASPAGSSVTHSDHSASHTQNNPASRNQNNGRRTRAGRRTDSPRTAARQKEPFYTSVSYESSPFSGTYISLPEQVLYQEETTALRGFLLFGESPGRYLLYARRAI